MAKLPMKSRTTQDNAFWRAFTETDGFKRSFSPEHLAVDIDIRQAMEKATRFGEQKSKAILKELLVAGEYSKLLTRYRQFKRRQRRQKRTIEIDESVYQRLILLQSRLGMTSHDSTFSDLLDYMLMAEPEDIWSQNHGEGPGPAMTFDAELNRPLSVRMERMLRAVHYIHRRTVEEAIHEAFSDGVRLGRLKKYSAKAANELEELSFLLNNLNNIE